MQRANNPLYYFMYLKQIITRNIQNHKEVVINLPPTGLVVFTGQNSNGKSVIVKTTRTILNGGIRKPRQRSSLINRNATFGEIVYVRDDGVRLTVHITRESSTNWIKWEDTITEPIVRYLSDKSYPELLQRFGWHYDENTGISLNIAEEEDSLLFYKTNNRTNNSIIETATCDTHANKVAEVFENTIKETRQFRDSSVQQANAMRSTLHDLVVEDTTELVLKLNKARRLLKNLEALYIPTIPEIKAVPNVKYVEVYNPSLPIVKYPRIVQVSFDIPDIKPIWDELNILKQNKCPTCGRGFDCTC